MRDKFVALDRDKCEYIYLLATSVGARGAIVITNNVSMDFALISLYV